MGKKKKRSLKAPITVIVLLSLVAGGLAYLYFGGIDANSTTLYVRTYYAGNEISDIYVNITCPNGTNIMCYSPCSLTNVETGTYTATATYEGQTTSDSVVLESGKTRTIQLAWGTQSPPITFTLENAMQPITTETYDGSGCAVHPDVIRFKTGFFGGLSKPYYFVMAVTPYVTDRLENPTVIVSLNGYSFVEDNIPNPITYPPPAPDHLSDTDIVYANNQIYLYYRWSGGEPQYNEIKLKTSTNLVTWSQEINVNIQGMILGRATALSPAVLFDSDSDMFQYWHVNRDVGIEYAESWDGQNFVNLQLTDMPLRIGEYVAWHINVQKLKLSKLYVSLVSYRLGDGYDNCLFFGQSEDGKHWVMQETPVLSPSNSGWDSRMIYRSSCLIETGKIKVWYSAQATNGPWHVGYTEADISDYLYAGEETLNVIGSPIVGGIYFSVDKLALLAPYIVATSTITLVTLAIALHTKHLIWFVRD